MGENKREKKKRKRNQHGVLVYKLLNCHVLYQEMIPMDFDSHGGIKMKAFYEHQRLGICTVVMWSISCPLSQGDEIRVKTSI